MFVYLGYRQRALSDEGWMAPRDRIIRVAFVLNTSIFLLNGAFGA